MDERKLAVYPFLPQALQYVETLGVSLEDMLTSFTINGAYANFLDEKTGSLEAGKQADFVVLDQDIFDLPAEEIGRTKVLQTYIDGELVYAADA